MTLLTVSHFNLNLFFINNHSLLSATLATYKIYASARNYQVIDKQPLQTQGVNCYSKNYSEKQLQFKLCTQNEPAAEKHRTRFPCGIFIVT